MSSPIPAPESSSLWKKYRVELLAHRLTGGTPTSEKLIEAWLSTSRAPAEARRHAERQLQLQGDLEAQHAVVFWRYPIDGTPAYESRAFKAALKEAANILGSSGTRDGVLNVKNFRSKLAERVFVDPRIGGAPIHCMCGQEHDPKALLHLEERPIQVMTMQGPRTSLKRVEYALEVPIAFTIRLLDDGIVKESHLRTILEYLQDGGIGADRSQGSGTNELLSFEQMA